MYLCHDNQSPDDGIRANSRNVVYIKYRVSQKDVYTRLIFRIIMCIDLFFGIPCIPQAIDNVHHGVPIINKPFSQTFVEQTFIPIWCLGI
jgi:hypothetical protein